MANMSENRQCILCNKTDRGPLTERERLGEMSVCFVDFHSVEMWVLYVGSTVAGSLDTITVQGQLHLTGFLNGIGKYLESEGDMCACRSANERENMLLA